MLATRSQEYEPHAEPDGRDETGRRRDLSEIWKREWKRVGRRVVVVVVGGGAVH